MIDLNTIPMDKKGAEKHLLARKIQLLELAEEISNNEVTVFSQVNGYILSNVEEIDALLGSQ